MNDWERLVRRREREHLEVLRRALEGLGAPVPKELTTPPPDLWVLLAEREDEIKELRSALRSLATCRTKKCYLCAGCWRAVWNHLGEPGRKRRALPRQPLARRHVRLLNGQEPDELGQQVLARLSERDASARELARGLGWSMRYVRIVTNRLRWQGAPIALIVEPGREPRYRLGAVGRGGIA